MGTEGSKNVKLNPNSPVYITCSGLNEPSNLMPYISTCIKSKISSIRILLQNIYYEKLKKYVFRTYVQQGPR